MQFDLEFYKEEFNTLMSKGNKDKFFIRESNDTFKIKKFLIKSQDSFKLVNYIKKSQEEAKNYWIITICYYIMLYAAKAAILSKGYETDDHYATQIALGYLLVPNEMQAEDLALLNQAYKIFNEEYIDYFEDARKESRTSRYSATKVYAERRVEEIYSKSQQFLIKIL